MELVVLTSQSLRLFTSLSIFFYPYFSILSLSQHYSLTFFSFSISPSLSLSISLSLSLSFSLKFMDSKGKAKKELMTIEADNDEIDDREDDSDSKKKKLASSAASATAAATSSVAKKGSGGLSPPSCQAEKCTADLTDAKRYHRRHKVCEHHAKAPVVIVGGLRQRFCQQCSRFHELSEFDETKRSCRRRLAGHNERRRKNSTESNVEGSGNGGAAQESHCRQADQSGRMPIALPASPTFKHFQIR